MLSIFKKRKNVLAIVLTSVDAKRALRAAKTLRDSPKNLTMDIEVIVNSLNKNYLSIVKEEFKKENIKITETESDGRAGKGKNSALDHFRNHKIKYDYLLAIDGDDFFYPSAFEQFEKALSKSPDILGLQISDELIISKEMKETPFAHKIKEDIFLHSWNDYELNLSKKFLKDVHKPVFNQSTPDRTFFLSERLLKEQPKLYYPEDLRFYDDYSFNVRLYAAALCNEYSYAQISSSYCYVYDKINEGSVSKESVGNVEELNHAFWKSIETSVAECNNVVDFTMVPHLKLGAPRNFSHDDKIDFIKKNLI